MLVKIVTEILFWQCAFGEPWNKHLGSWSQTSALNKDRDLDHMCARENSTTGARSWYGYRTLKPWILPHRWNITIQVGTMTTSCKYHWKCWEGGGFTNTTTFKQRKNATGRSTSSESWETLTHQPHRFSKTGAYGYRHDGYGDVPGPGWCYMMW